MIRQVIIGAAIYPMEGGKMLKKTTAFVVAVSLLLCLCTYAGASALREEFYKPELLRFVKDELERAETKLALVMTDRSDVRSVRVEEIAGVIAERDGVRIYFRENGSLVSGRYLEPDLIKHYDSGSSVIPEDMTAIAAGSDIGLDRLRELVEDSEETVTVAVLDTGIDISHPWFQQRITAPYDAANDDSEPEDLYGHGTHVAGVIAQNTPANVLIMPVRVFTDEGEAPDSVIVKGIDYAVKNGADVINISLGGYGTTSYLDKAIDYAYSQGVVIVVSAGNKACDVSHYYPAAFGEVITVGATARNGDHLYFSNTGDFIDVCAPGEKIISSAPGGSTATKSGTSMAAPFISSAAAMLLAEDPSRTPAAIESIITTYTDDLGAPGKDKLFGFGEASFGNYKENPDFYLIESSRESLPSEEKHDLNIGYYAGESVTGVEVRIDGAAVLQTPSQGAGVYKATIDIRNLGPGVHSLEILPAIADGTQLAPVQRSFTIPEYNIRIKVYDINDDLVSNPKISAIGFTEEDKYVSRIKTESVVVGGVWMTNLDLGALSADYDKIRLAVDPGMGGFGDIPLYLRTVGTCGEKVYESSECLATAFTTYDDMPGCTVVTRVVGERIGGFDYVRPWGNGAYEAAVSMEDLTFVSIGESQNAGLLYYDTAKLWIDIYSYSGGARKRAEENADEWYFSGELDDLESMVDLDRSELTNIIMSTDLSAAGPIQYMLVDIPSGNYIQGSLKAQTGSLSVKPGVYDLFLLPERNLGDKGVSSDVFYRSFITRLSGTREYARFGKSLVGRFIYDSTRKQILHKWVDDFGNGYTVYVRREGQSDICMPTLSLTNSKGIELTIEGTEVMDAGDYIHGYSLSSVPDGSYRMTFVNKQDMLAYPVRSSWTLITVRKGEIYYPSNTPPVAFSDYIADIWPGDPVFIDLSDEFSDNEQNRLEYSASTGWIVDDIFFYRDFIGKDIDITVTAYDGAGGSASFTYYLRVSDRTPAEEGYIPNPDIDSIGASSWAMPFIKNAILANIVPADLLDNYQANISRAEFSSLIVEMAETFMGEITPAPGVSFKDTRDEDVLKAASVKFLAGSNGYFNPFEELSRQQFCVIAYQAIGVIRPDIGKPVSNAPQFRDANEVASWAKTAVDFCTAKGIIVGSNGILNPTGKLSREQAILMLYKVYELCKSN